MIEMIVSLELSVDMEIILNCEWGKAFVLVKISI